jgi:hypothetical protein
MANEIVFNYTSGLTLYALLFDATGQIWNGSAFVAPGSTNWTDYDIALAEVATATGIYRATMPSVSAGAYTYTIRQRAGGAPAVTDAVVGSGALSWSGVAATYTAATYTTATTVKTYLGISGSGDDTLLGTLCSAAQSLIDAYTGRTFAADSDSTRYLDPTVCAEGLTLRIPWDLCAITSITSGGAAVASTEYVTQPRYSTPYYALELRVTATAQWTYTTDPADGVAITGRWAYSTTAPADIAQAATRLAAWLYRQKDAQTFDTTAQTDMGIITVPQGLPKDVIRLLAPYRRQL